jgi:hypothetical protein
MTFAHLQVAAPWMRKSLERNTDPDFYGVEELEHAPINTDPVEGNFSKVDQLCNLPSSYVQAWLGVSHSSSMGLLLGKGDLYDRCKQEVKKEEKKGVSNTCDREARIAFKMKCKGMTNFFSLERHVRWLLIKDVRLKYKVNFVPYPPPPPLHFP